MLYTLASFKAWIHGFWTGHYIQDCREFKRGGDYLYHWVRSLYCRDCDKRFYDVKGSRKEQSKIKTVDVSKLPIADALNKVSEGIVYEDPSQFHSGVKI